MKFLTLPTKAYKAKSIINSAKKMPPMRIELQGCGNLVDTLQEHQKFWTNATISLISYLLKSMGGIFPEFFP